VSRRDAIRMDHDEVVAFLEEQRIVTLATLGRDGWPHLMPLWYVLRDRGIWAWTYAKSQKVRNLERDPRCTLQVEDGERYDQLRGVMLRAEATIHRDIETVAGIGAALAARYGGDSLDGEVDAAMRAQAAKRIALSFEVRHMATWDHRKLGGGY
jgi:PPOX class probable F420-dependent enzyme